MRIGTLTFDDEEEICIILDMITFTTTERAYANSIWKDWEGSLLDFVTHVQEEVEDIHYR